MGEVTNNSKYVLIVDDNLSNLEVTATVLKGAGFLISLAQSGRVALGQLQQLKPDIIILDIFMPEMDGIELCRIIKENARLKDIPVLFLTGSDLPYDLREAFYAGGVDYITKPFKQEELILRVKNHLELSEFRKEIIEMNILRDKLYSVIAHDIRSPLADMSTVISAMSSGLLNPCSSDFPVIIKQMEKTINETNLLIDNLLTYTNLQNHNMQVLPECLPVTNVLMHCIDMHRGNADKKNISITLNIPENTMAYFNETSMQSVFRNLIINAVKFTPEYGTLDISATITEEYVNISFKDSGVGIPEETKNRLFSGTGPFTTLGTNGEKGSGLGTYIVKDFVKKNNGKLIVNSKPDRGTEIIVSLPVSGPMKMQL